MGDVEWGPWVEHDGRGCPVRRGCRVEISVSHGVDVPKANRKQFGNKLHPAWSWALRPSAYRIVQYRLARPAVLRQLVDLVENPPAPVAPREKVDA